MRMAFDEIIRILYILYVTYIHARIVRYVYHNNNNNIKLNKTRGTIWGDFIM